MAAMLPALARWPAPSTSSVLGPPLPTTDTVPPKPLLPASAAKRVMPCMRSASVVPRPAPAPSVSRSVPASTDCMPRAMPRRAASSCTNAL
ncbi:hypothetical protein G6F40_016324 [Rhizopus arrhizus]|nr:hypothetical protein G6F24_017625 [Rhizopus arrhizus]KAG1079403.1 hypothetical protein G6F40_016324 [Rhizopus arrhizus]